MTDLIFGYTWEEIQAAQQGKPLTHVPPGKTEGANAGPSLPGDIDLLTRLGLKELETRGYFGVIDRLARAGIINA